MQIALIFLPSLVFSYDFSGKKIEGIDVVCENKEIVEKVNSLFTEQIGSKASPAKIGFILKALQIESDIESVIINASDYSKGDSLRLKVVVRLKFRAASISFEGNNYFSASELKNKLDLKRGGVFSQDDIERIARNLKNIYAESGFIQFAATHKKIYFGEKDSGILKFEIEEGQRCKIKEVRLEGKLTEKIKNRILRKLSIKSGQYLDEKRIEKKLNSLIKKLRKEGYRLLKISQPLIEYDSHENTARIKFDIVLGPKIRVIFKGNNYLFERDSILKEVIRYKEEKHFSLSWVQSANFEIERFYKSRGYALAKITSSDTTDEGSDERVIKFNIEKNHGVVIEKVKFKGNKEYSSEKLEKMVLNFDFPSIRSGRYYREDFRRALKSLIRFYQTQGYLQAEIAGDPIVEFNKRGNRVNITVSLSEGKKHFVENIEIKGNSFVSKEKLIDFLNMHVKDPYDPYLAQDSLKKISKFYVENGYKFFEIYAQEKIEGDKVTLSLILFEGDRVKIGSISIDGNKTTDDKVIRREFRLKEGDYYSASKFSNSEGNVARLGLFSSVVLEEESYSSTDRILNLKLSVKEKKKRSLRFKLGYGSDEGLRTGVDLTVINIGGKGRILGIGGQLSHRMKSDRILRRRETVSFREPRLFGTKLAGKIGLIDEREEEPQFNIDRSALALGVDTALSKAVRASLTYNIEYRKPFDLKIAEEDLSPFDESRKRFGFIDLSLDYDKRDNIFNTKKGFLSRLTFDAYNKSLWSEINFLQVYSQNSLYIPIFKGIRIIAAMKFGFSATYGSTKNTTTLIPIEKRFRLGGSYTLRGFSRNSVGGLAPDQPAVGSDDPDDQAPGGNSVFNYNLELIFPFIFNFDFVLFTDGGEAWESNSDFNPFDIRNTAGFGLRYNTPVGPLRIDVGFILDRRTGEEWGSIQFAVGLL